MSDFGSKGRAARSARKPTRSSAPSRWSSSRVFSGRADLPEVGKPTSISARVSHHAGQFFAASTSIPRHGTYTEAKRQLVPEQVPI